VPTVYILIEGKWQEKKERERTPWDVLCKHQFQKSKLILILKLKYNNGIR
jgi:hypothetical protein